MAVLAEAYLAYRRGRILISSQAFARSVKELEPARRRFAEASSPMASVAAFYIASAAYANNDVGEALRLLRHLASAERNAKGHYASLAHILWTTAVCEATNGRWSDSIRDANEALGIFDRLGENGNAAAMHNMLSENFEFLGDPVRARHHAVEGIRLSSDAGDRYLLQVAMGVASRTEIRRQRWQVARAFAALELKLAGRGGEPVLVTHSLARLAVAEYRLGNNDASATAIQRARIVAARVEDDALRTKLVGDVTAIDGAMLRDRDPLRAVALLTQSIAFHERTGRTFALPELYLERGRCSSSTR